MVIVAFSSFRDYVDWPKTEAAVFLSTLTPTEQTVTADASKYLFKLINAIMNTTAVQTLIMGTIY